MWVEVSGSAYTDIWYSFSVKKIDIYYLKCVNYNVVRKKITVPKPINNVTLYVEI